MLSLQDFLKPQVNESPLAQAQRIFAILQQQLNEDPNKKIALLYSANNSQAEQLHAANDKDQNLPQINGGGQALLFAQLIPLINASHFNKRIRVLPVSTSLIGGSNGKGNIVSLDMIKRDLKAIQIHLVNGYEVYGIPNNHKQFAIGGAISNYWFTQDFVHINYKGMPWSQGAFVQNMLEELQKDSHFNLDQDFEQFENNGLTYYRKKGSGIKLES